MLKIGNQFPMQLSVLVLLIAVLFPQRDFPLGIADCFSDSVAAKNAPITFVDYLAKSARKKFRREKVELFKPIRIKTIHLDNTELSTEQQIRLSKVVDAAVGKISSILSVIPIQGKLLLTRTDACLTYWAFGINAGRCSRIKPSYKGEFCLEEHFRIPNDHLQGIELFDTTRTEPLPTSIQDGQGIPDCDLVVYIRGTSTDKCQSKDLVAYATHCQLDQRNRPLAGSANFCPYHLQDKNFNFTKAVYVMIHEFLHIVGFSAKLFPKYSTCSSEGNVGKCVRNKIFSVTDAGTKLVLPTLVQKMMAHFNCNDTDIGAFLQKVPNKQPRNGELASSHWHPEGPFYASIMAPNLAQLEYITIDEFTLATLEDSGWYKVNYSSADKYPYGKGTGCKFVDKPCEDTEKSQCSDKPPTCDFLHRGKVKCESSCATANSVRCSDADAIGVNTWEKSGESSRCFATRYENGTVGAACLFHRCHQSNLFVEVEGHWHLCPSDDNITFKPDTSKETVTILCPGPLTFCGRPKWNPVENQEDFISQKPLDETSTKNSTVANLTRESRRVNIWEIYFTFVFLQYVIMSIDMLSIFIWTTNTYENAALVDFMYNSGPEEWSSQEPPFCSRHTKSYKTEPFFRVL